MAGMLEGRVALITGAGSGIGSVVAHCLAREGAHVLVSDRTLDGAERVAANISSTGPRALAMQADVASADDNDRLVALATSEFGRLDISVLNAAVHVSSPKGTVPGLGDADDIERFDHVMGINLRGTFFGIRSAYQAFGAGGSVICMASLAGLFGYADDPAYTASKHGVLGLVRAFAHGFGQKQARINAICSGGVTKPPAGPSGVVMQDPDNLLVPAYGSSSLAQHIGEWAILLASPRTSSMNGEIITLDNGQAGLPVSYNQ